MDCIKIYEQSKRRASASAKQSNKYIKKQLSSLSQLVKSMFPQTFDNGETFTILIGWKRSSFTRRWIISDATKKTTYSYHARGDMSSSPSSYHEDSWWHTRTWVTCRCNVENMWRTMTSCTLAGYRQRQTDARIRSKKIGRVWGSRYPFACEIWSDTSLALRTSNQDMRFHPLGHRDQSTACRRCSSWLLYQTRMTAGYEIWSDSKLYCQALSSASQSRSTEKRSHALWWLQGEKSTSDSISSLAFDQSWHNRNNNWSQKLSETSMSRWEKMCSHLPSIEDKGKWWTLTFAKLFIQLP